MSECKIRGCRNLYTACKDCGRIVSTAMFKSEWIKVPDRLPEPWVDVLVWCQNLGASSSFEMDEYYAAIDRWCIWTDDHPPSFRTTRFFGVVIAWMPLPSPPEDK